MAVHRYSQTLEECLSEYFWHHARRQILIYVTKPIGRDSLIDIFLYMLLLYRKYASRYSR